jgi:hypothetical protein
MVRLLGSTITWLLSPLLLLSMSLMVTMDVEVSALSLEPAGDASDFALLGTDDYPIQSSMAINWDGTVLSIGIEDEDLVRLLQRSSTSTTGTASSSEFAEFDVVVSSETNEDFGYAQSLSDSDGLTLAVGARKALKPTSLRRGLINAGRVVIYTRPSALTTFSSLSSSGSTASATVLYGSASGDEFGTAVVLSEDGLQLFVSAPKADVQVNGIRLQNTGIVYAFERDSLKQAFQESTASVYQLAGLKNANDKLGTHMKLSGDKLTLVIQHAQGFVVLTRATTIYSFPLFSNSTTSVANSMGVTLITGTVTDEVPVDSEGATLDISQDGMTLVTLWSKPDPIDATKKVFFVRLLTRLSPDNLFLRLGNDIPVQNANLNQRVSVAFLKEPDRAGGPGDLQQQVRPALTLVISAYFTGGAASRRIAFYTRYHAMETFRLADQVMLPSGEGSKPSPLWGSLLEFCVLPSSSDGGDDFQQQVSLFVGTSSAREFRDKGNVQEYTVVSPVIYLPPSLPPPPRDWNITRTLDTASLVNTDTSFDITMEYRSFVKNPSSYSHSHRLSIWTGDCLTGSVSNSVVDVTDIPLDVQANIYDPDYTQVQATFRIQKSQVVNSGLWATGGDFNEVGVISLCARMELMMQDNDEGGGDQNAATTQPASMTFSHSLLTLTIDLLWSFNVDEPITLIPPDTQARMVEGASRSMSSMLEPSPPQENGSIDLQACQCDSETLQCFSDDNIAPLLQVGDLVMVCLAFPQGIELSFVSSLTLAQASAYSKIIKVDAINLTTVTTRQLVLPNNGTSSNSLTMISPSLLTRQEEVAALETPVWSGFFLAPHPGENPPNLIVTGEVVHKLVTVDGDDVQTRARDDGPDRHREREHNSDSDENIKEGRGQRQRQLYPSPSTARSTFELHVKLAPVIASSSPASTRTCILGRCWLPSSLAIVVAVLLAGII